MGSTSPSLSQLNLADYIDHTLLDPRAVAEDIKTLCEQALFFNFPSVCVYPWTVPLAVEYLHRSPVKVSTVIGFPTGATTTAVKRYEAEEALEAGATELDVVINQAWLKMGQTDPLYAELASLCELPNSSVKAILEMTQLTRDEQQLAAEIAMDAGARFLKTSTGWFGGATVEAVRTLADIARDRVGIKASGGIRTLDQVYALIEAGATRLGTSQGVALMAAWEASR
jgi:deoxyribose-phosphate aldolase